MVGIAVHCCSILRAAWSICCADCCFLLQPYLLSPTLDTRTYALIMGGVFSSLCFVSRFRDFRLLSLIGVASTLYTAFYLTIEAARQGPIENVDYTAPTDFYSFFTGFTDLLFIFGGHTAAIEKASEMNNPEKYL